MEKSMMFIAISLLVIFSLSKVKSGCLLFNFGDSNSDTGSSLAMTGDDGGNGTGRLFFHRPTGRLSDGRLVIDLLSENASLPLLSPYMRPFDGDFRNGANFAFSGSTATTIKENCFSLQYQIRHFRSFKSLIESEMYCKIKISKDRFGSAVYMFDIGQNDLTLTILDLPITLEKSTAVIPPVLAEMKRSIETLYKEVGARKFWIHNTGPLGCLPRIKEGVTLLVSNPELDPIGCVAVANNASKQLNAQLHDLVDELRGALLNSSILYIDIYSIKYDLFVNYTKLGFQKPFSYCAKQDSVCPEGSKYITWDGIHYTELANSMVATKILSGYYSDPPIKFADLCNT